MTVLATSSFRRGIDDSLATAATYLPKIGYFLLILVVGVVIAKVVQKILTTVLQKAGFDRLVERGGIKQALSKSKYDAAGILGKIVYYFIFLAVLSAAFAVFGDNPVSSFLATIIGYLPRLFVAVLVLVIAFAVAAAVKDLVSNALGGLSYGATLANVASLFITAVGVFFALGQLQIAPLIVGGVFYAVLALIVVPPIIAFGVGGIDPAREVIQDLRGKTREKAREIAAEASSSTSEPSPVPVAAASAAPTRARAPRKPRSTP